MLPLAFAARRSDRQQLLTANSRRSSVTSVTTSTEVIVAIEKGTPLHPDTSNFLFPEFIPDLSLDLGYPLPRGNACSKRSSKFKGFLSPDMTTE